MKLTTGYDFQGYFITEYIDVIFDEILVGIGFGKAIMSGLDNLVSAFTGTEATEMIEKLNKVKQQLRERLIKKAERLGADGLIGIDFESSKLGDLIMVSMTATAVKLSKIVRPLPYTEMDEKNEQETEKQAKLREERRIKLEKLQNADNKSDILEGIIALESTAEMYQVVSENSEYFDQETLESLKRCVSRERIYGRGSGRDSFIKIIKEFIGK